MSVINPIQSRYWNDLQESRAYSQRLANYSDEEWKVTFLEVVSKIVWVVNSILMIGFWVGWHYLPTWATWGVCLPANILLSVFIKPYFDNRIDREKKEKISYTLMQAMAGKHHPDLLRPRGEYELFCKNEKKKEEEFNRTQPFEGVDKRLSSDTVLYDKVIASQHQSVRDLQKTISSPLDLAVTTATKFHIAHKLAQVQGDQLEWDQIRGRVKEVKSLLLNDDRAGYKEKMAALQAEALNLPNKSGYFKNIASKSWERDVRERREGLERRAYFTKLYDEVAALHQEGKVLYKGNSFEGWSTYKKDVGNLWNKLVANKYHLESVNYAEIIEKSRCIKSEIERWIDRHATKRWERLESRRKAVKGQVFPKEIFDRLSDRVQQNPNLVTISVEELLKTLSKDKMLKTTQEDIAQLKKWINSSAVILSESTKKLIERHLCIYAEVEKMENVFTAPVIEELDVPSEGMLGKQRFEYLVHQIEQEKEKLSQLEELVGDCEGYVVRRGISRAENFWNQHFRMGPVDSFEKTIVPKKQFKRRVIDGVEKPLLINGVERFRKIEERSLQNRLQTTDESMSLANRIYRVIGLGGVQGVIQVIAIIAFAAFSLYSNPWAMLGFSLGTAALQMLTSFAEYHLGQMDRRKKVDKLHHSLREGLLINRVAADRPELLQLQKVAREYDLDGVSRTWARALIKEDALGLSRSTSRVEILRKARKGKSEIENYQQTRRYLLQCKLYTLSIAKKGASKEENEKRVQQRKEVQKEITALQSSLHYKPNRRQAWVGESAPVTNGIKMLLAERKKQEIGLDLLTREKGRLEAAIFHAGQVRRELGEKYVVNELVMHNDLIRKLGIELQGLQDEENLALVNGLFAILRNLQTKLVNENAEELIGQYFNGFTLITAIMDQPLSFSDYSKGIDLLTSMGGLPIGSINGILIELHKVRIDLLKKEEDTLKNKIKVEMEVVQTKTKEIKEHSKTAIAQAKVQNSWVYEELYRLLDLAKKGTHKRNPVRLVDPILNKLEPIVREVGEKYREFMTVRNKQNKPITEVEQLQRRQEADKQYEILLKKLKRAPIEWIDERLVLVATLLKRKAHG